MKLIRTLLLFALGYVCTAPVRAESGAKQLPIDIVQRVCDKYAGKPAFVRKGEVMNIDCPYVDRLGKISEKTLVQVYREILLAAETIEGLRLSRKLPTDLFCGKFDERRQGPERAIECTSTLAGEVVPFKFISDEHGKLLRFETVFDFRKIYRSTLERAVSRGDISKFYASYVDLQTDLLVEKLRHTAQDHDIVAVNDGVVRLVVLAIR
jgi:hypothetical protein